MTSKVPMKNFSDNTIWLKCAPTKGKTMKEQRELGMVNLVLHFLKISFMV